MWPCHIPILSSGDSQDGHLLTYDSYFYYVIKKKLYRNQPTITTVIAEPWADDVCTGLCQNGEGAEASQLEWRLY